MKKWIAIPVFTVAIIAVCFSTMGSKGLIKLHDMPSTTGNGGRFLKLNEAANTFEWTEGIQEKDDGAVDLGSSNITTTGQIENGTWITVSTETQLVAALADSGVQDITLLSPITLTAAKTFTKPVHQVKGAIITHSAVNTLTLSVDPPHAAYQRFAAVAGVVWSAGATDEVLPEWFGAVGDAVAGVSGTDDTTAIRAAVTCLGNSEVKKLRLAWGKTYLCDTITPSVYVEIEGASREDTWIWNNFGTAGFTIPENATAAKWNRLSNFTLTATGTSPASTVAGINVIKSTAGYTTRVYAKFIKIVAFYNGMTVDCIEDSEFENIIVSEAGNDGFQIRGSAGTVGVVPGNVRWKDCQASLPTRYQWYVYDGNLYGHTWDHCGGQGGVKGFFVEHNQETGTISNLVFLNSSSELASQEQLHLKNVVDTQVIGGDWGRDDAGVDYHILKLEGVKRCTFNGLTTWSTVVPLNGKGIYVGETTVINPSGAQVAGSDVVETTGSSTTVTVPAADYAALAFNSTIIANSLTRYVVALLGSNQVQVNAAVDWSNGGSGYSYVYIVPLGVSHADNSFVNGYFRQPFVFDTSVGAKNTQFTNTRAIYGATTYMMPGHGGIISAVTLGTATTTAGTDEDTLQSVTIPGGWIPWDGGIRFSISGSTSGTNDVKTIRLKFGSAVVTYTAVAGISQRFRISGTITGTTDSVVKNVQFMETSFTQGFSYPICGAALPEEDLTGDIVFTLTGQCTNGGDAVTFKSWVIEKIGTELVP